MSGSLNTFTSALSEVLAERVFEDKLVLAPSRRTAFQWLDAVARSGRPVFNARAEMLKGLAMSLASAELESRGLRLATELELTVLADGVVADMAGGDGGNGGDGPGARGYLSALGPGAGFTRMVSTALGELRMAGLGPDDLTPGSFEVERKGLEMKAMLASFERSLADRGLVDFPGVLALAAGALAADPSSMEGRLVVAPEDMVAEMAALERALFESLPEGGVLVLPVDRPCEVPPGFSRDELADAMLLRWSPDPRSAPRPRGDGTARVQSAVGEVNEVREVFRWCASTGTPLDEVEVLYTDTDTYVPLFYEIAAGMASGPGEGLPVTFADGIPARYSRPGRALAAWLSWTREGFPQQRAVRMVRDGLLRVPEGEAPSLSFARLAAVLRTVPVGAGADRYVPELQKAASAAARRLEDAAGSGEAGAFGERSASSVEVQALTTRLEALEALTAMIGEVTAGVPVESGERIALLQRARRFLERSARAVNMHDAYCSERLVERISELEACLQEGGAGAFDVSGWLDTLPDGERVGGRGPGPGCLHVASLRSGGHAGRPHTFILGMDDTRFPGAGMQDPLLLDSERSALSESLATASGRLDERVRAFAGTVGRLRGTVVLSHCSRNLTDDREMFPGRVLQSARRVLEGRPVTTVDTTGGPPASFAPSRAERCIDMTEWWVWRACSSGPAPGASDAIGIHFPNLGRGMSALEARAGDAFTEYDGYVPAAGADHDCAADEGPVLSPSRLETFARCPLEYFFANVLGVKPPEEYETDPAGWLDPLERGSLLHAVFCDFMRELASSELMPPEFARDGARLRSLVDRHVERMRAEKPAPLDPGVFAREREALKRTAEVFLQMEEVACADRVPVACELAVGVRPDGMGTAFDVAEPHALGLPGGRTVRVRCKIDRVDALVPGTDEYVVCDYKTGSSTVYHSRGPFHNGRFMQGTLYPVLAEFALRGRLGGEPRVVRFEYVFPAPGEARRLSWGTDELADGLHLVGLVCDMMASGCFPFTDDEADLKYSEYTGAFGDIAGALASVRRKLDNPENVMLEPYRRLRGLRGAGREGEGDD